MMIDQGGRKVEKSQRNKDKGKKPSLGDQRRADVQKMLVSDLERGCLQVMWSEDTGKLWERRCW